MKRASLTAETALVFPLFFFSVVALIYIIMWFQTAEKLQKDLVNEARFISASAYTDTAKEKDKDEDIAISRDYFMRIECPVLSLFKVRLHQGVRMRKFIGVYDIAGEDDSEIVYITANGKVYHKNSACTYLRAKTEEMLYSDIEYARNINGEKYKRCLKCVGRNAGELSAHERVYVSRYGNRYHISDSCSAVTKNVMPVKISEVHNMRPCSKCG